MASIVCSENGSGRTEMESFDSGGMALLPRTKQMLTVLWEQLRLLLQVIYYTFLSVFQLFRFEVHLRITDETGQHIQHMGTAANPSDSFLFSSLFDGDSGVMVGGSGHLSNFCGDMGDPFTGKNTTEALLSSLRAEELCCGLVDEFVSRSSGKEDGMFGPQSSWKMGFTSDWNIFGSSSDGSCHKSSSEEERSSPWSSEEDQNLMEFDSEDSRKLWDSLSRSSDPYNPFFFSACISTNSERQNTEPDLMPVSETSMEFLGSGSPGGRCTWVSRSDSETSWSSDGSTLDEDTEQLLEFFTNSDPYNPLCFTACTSTSPPNTATSTSLPALPPIESSPLPSSEDDEEAQLWKSLCIQDDPYHPLNFKAHLRNSTKTTTSPTASCGGRHPLMSDQKVAKAKNKPHLPERHFKHQHPETTMVPWTRPRTTGRKDNKAGSTHKKVQFSPVVQVHVMRTWTYARQASRKGNWEEMARDRDRFQRRIKEAEQSIGPCFSHGHRRKMRAYLDGRLAL